MMRAARLLENRTELTVTELPELEVRPGSVIVRIESVFAPGWLRMLVDGTRRGLDRLLGGVHPLD